MRFQVLFEFDHKNLFKAMEKEKEYVKEVKKNPDKYPKRIFPMHVTVDKFGGFYVVEATHEQLGRLSNYFGSLLNYKFIPVMEAAPAMDISMETKK